MIDQEQLWALAEKWRRLAAEHNDLAAAAEHDGSVGEHEGMAMAFGECSRDLARLLEPEKNG